MLRCPGTMASILQLNIKGYIIIKDENGRVISRIDNAINGSGLANAIAFILNNKLPSQSSGNSVIIANNNISINVTVSVSGTTITWSGSTTFNSSTTITSLALYPIFYEGSNSYQIQASSITLSTPLQLNAGTYTFTWVWEFTADQSQGLIPTLLTLSLQKNLSSVSVSYDVNGSGASGFVGATTSAVFFVVYIQSVGSTTTVSSYSVTVSLTPSSGSAQSFTLSAGLVPITVPQNTSFIDFITIFIV
jgi:hypothetical protein